MSTFRTRVGAISAGLTQMVYGTAVDVDLPSDARYLLGVEISGADPTYTTAEGGAGMVKLHSDSFKGDIELLTGPITTSGPGTNGSGQAMTPDYVDLAVEDLSGGDAIKVSATVTTTLTTARLYEVVLISSDVAPPKDWFAWANDGCGPFAWAAVQAGTQLTTTRTALTGIQMPGWIDAIRGVRAVMHKTGAITAGEEVMGTIEITSTKAKLGEQSFVTNALGATLGTPVGTGMYHDHIEWARCVIPSGGAKQTITPYVNLRTAVTTANRVAVCIAGV